MLRSSKLSNLYFLRDRTLLIFPLPAHLQQLVTVWYGMIACLPSQGLHKPPWSSWSSHVLPCPPQGPRCLWLGWWCLDPSPSIALPRESAESLVRVKEQLEAVRQIPSWDVSRCVEMFRGCKFEHVASKCVSCLCRPDAKIPMKQVVDRSWDLFHSMFILCACTEYSFFSHDLYTNLHFILINYPFMLPSDYHRSTLIKVLSRAASNWMCF